MSEQSQMAEQPEGPVAAQVETLVEDQSDTRELLDTSLIKRRKTPITLQSEAMECGLASLSMVMATFGRRIDLTVLRERYPASMRGVSFARLCDLAEKEGFLLTSYTAKADEMAELKLPGILHWKGNHFVVMTEYKVGKSVTLHDPAIGLRRVPWAQFVAGFSGACCELEPLATMQPEVQTQRLSLFTLLQKTAGYGGMLAKMGLISLALEILILISPLFLQTVVDAVLPVRDGRLLWALGMGFIGVAIVKSALRLTQGWLSMALSGMLSLAMKQMTFNHLLKLPLKWFEKRGIGAATTRFRSLDNIRTILASNVLMSMVDSVIAFVMVGVLLVYEWKLALLTLALSAVSLGTTLLLYRRYALAAAEGVLADAEEGRVLVESITAMPAVKMFGQEMRQLQNYRRMVVTSTNRMLDMLRVKTWSDAAQMLLASVGDVTIVSAAAYYVLTGSLSLGVMFGFYAYKQILSEKLNNLSTSYFQFRLLSVYTDNVADVLLSPPEDDNNRPLKVSTRPTLKFEDVNFTYDEADRPTLKSFNLTVAPGEIVGVTGRSGGGKSTLIKLLTGSLQPTRGSIRLDDEELVGIPPRRVREHLAVVLQHDHLLTGTLLDNITMFEALPDMTKVAEAVADAGLTQDIAAIPTGLSTFIMGHAPTLSGGQRQRLMLARAFYKSAAVLVLDEATSALDVALEVHVCDAIRRKGLTTVMVAHRQETLARCDRVVRLGD